jgi:hypothetical protein
MTFSLVPHDNSAQTGYANPKVTKVLRMQNPVSAQAVLWLLLTCSPLLHAQTRVVTLAPAERPISVHDVIKLWKAGYSDALIIEQIKKKQTHFNLTTEQLLQLKAAHVGEQVVKYMINPAIALVAPCTPNAAPLPAAQTQTEPGQSTLPTEAGIYVKQDGGWTSMLPELVNWKSQSALKSAASLSFVKGDLGGLVDGPMSRNNFVSPLEFLIVMPEGVAIGDYQLVQLHRREGNREFRIATGGITHASNDAGRDMMVFTPVRVSPRAYVIKLKVYAGEYGFLPPDSITARNEAALAKIFTFRIME